MTESFHHAIEVEELGQLRKRITVRYDAEGVRLANEAATNEVGKQVQIKGFRRGHAPKSLIKNYCETQIKTASASMLLQKSYLHACNEYQLLVLNEPEFDEPEFTEDGGFTCAFVVEVRPKIEPTGYVGLQLEKVAGQDREQVFDQLLENLKQNYLSDVQVDMVDDSTMTTVDFDVFVGTEKVNSGAKQPFYIRAGTDGPFGGNLIGKVVGETCVETITLPKEYENFGGKEAQVHITVRSIIKKVEPTNEELVVRTESPSYEELVNVLWKKPDQVIQQRQSVALEEQAIDKLLEFHTFEVPTSWVDAESKYMLGQFGLEKAPDEQTAEFVKNMAERNVRRTFLLESVYEAEPSLKLTQEDLTQVLEAEAQTHGVSTLIVKKEWEEKKMLSSVLASIKQKKVMSFILSNAQLVEAAQPETQLIISEE